MEWEERAILNASHRREQSKEILQRSRLQLVRTSEPDPIQVSSRRHAKQSSAIFIESRTNRDAA